MTHPLAELREHLLYLPDISDKLRTADSYLSMMGRMGESFILPAEHAVLKPILDYYAGDLKGWFKYVKGIRDSAGKTHSDWTGLQDFYRTLEVRLTQRERRERLNAAIAVAVQKRLIDDTADAKRRYEKRCVQVWMAERVRLQESARRGKKSHRLSEGERSVILEEFWDDIDQQIAAGDVPEP